MPQLDIATYTEQIFWLVITFAALYIVMARFALPRIGGIIEQRKDRTVADLTEAEKLQTECQKAEAQFKEAKANTIAKARETENNQKEKEKKKINQKINQLEQNLMQKINDAEKDIEQKKQQTIEQIKNMTKDITNHIVTHVTKIKT